ncbi:Rieske 2Fe-2S domain-containing protein [Granulosicoccus antarcticus]|uniref:Phenoxybenzoate dioxygenase subunit beta n=1 Tax=Granulosicoccus antarcticus IMCC3135 TaxID=1192854 RepID=A0A2Z2P7Y1_9GAMM|nr:Rieske 2Fe-2S domain-containing protein [Granulosicoccus antarcticus]ASJ76787.1 Phenoxybenzoate dioxygenase subunit beta [Granulosicoccus antarcticus IMCC3135]
MIDLEAARYLWHPVAASSDLVYRHVYQAMILGRELAVWRADDGNVNVWENRCLHRGVRLSIGINDGTELVCQYHGWRYANRTAGCTYIPAHPADAPARSICNNTYAVAERFGLIWSGESPDVALPELGMLDTSHVTPLMGMTLNAPLHRVALPLIEAYTVQHSTQIGTQSVRYGANTPDPYTIILHADCSQSESPSPDIAFFLQPIDSGRTAIRGVLCGLDETTTDKASITQLLRCHHHVINNVRRQLESLIASEPAPAPWIPIIPTVSEAQAGLPPLGSSGRSATQRVRVAAIDTVAQHIKSFRLEAISVSGALQLPASQPGAHIDVHLPEGLIRQYSLINGPGQTDHYAIAVKETADSAGGSSALHHNIRVGDLLATSAPRNNFTLRRDAEHTMLLAGGIGLTPLLSMARALNKMARPFTLHYFVTTEDQIMFRDELESLHGDVQFHIGLDPQQTEQKLATLLANPPAHHHLYLCGPGPMMDCARDTASSRGWADNTVHFEYFKNLTTLDDSSSFVVELARSGLTLQVPAGESLLTTLRHNGVAVPSSCEQGSCGTCRVNVLEGEPDHQDVYLSQSEQARGDCLMSCVSRARSEKLVLDL